MVDGELFDKLAAIGSVIRGKFDKPFGGIQVRLVLGVIVSLSY
jgi:hypothetical protein